MSVIKDMKRTALAFCLAFLVAPQLAHGMCLDGWHPSAEKEFQESEYVIIGTATAARTVASPSDPDGYDATIYSVRIDRQFKGKKQHKIKIWSENSSSRFEILEAKRYVLFVRSGSDGFYVDSCGNSGPLKNNKVDIKLLENLNKELHRIPRPSD